MKEFEDWKWKNVVGRGYDPFCCFAAAEDGWRAALEWVLNNNEVFTDQLDFIKEELDEKV